MSDRTQRAEAVLLEEQVFSSTSGSIDLAGTIRTVNHGRFQRAFGSGWITATAGFRRGSVSQVDLAGVTSSQGQEVTALAATWTQALPPPENTADYASRLKTFNDLLYCRRCGLFSGGRTVAMPLREAVARSFGVRYMIQRTLRSFGESRIDLEALGLPAGAASSPFQRYVDLPTGERSNWMQDLDRVRAALIELKAVESGPEVLVDTGDGLRCVVYSYELGSAWKAKMVGQFGWKTHPTIVTLAAGIEEDNACIGVGGFCYLPDVKTGFGMKGTWSKRHEQIMSLLPSPRYQFGGNVPAAIGA